MDYSYEQVSPYLLDYEIIGSKIHCEFQNEHGEVFSSTSNVKATKTIQSKVAKRAERMIKSQARRNASRLVRTAFGGGMLGSIGSSVVRSSVNDVDLGTNKEFSEENIQEAITKAFKRVSRNFDIGQKSRPATARRERRTRERDNSRRGSSSNSDLGYKEYIKMHPISNMFEQDIMSRLLVQMASADGKIMEEERNFILDMLPKKFGTIPEIIARGDISKIEASEVSDEIKKTIMLLAWSVALVDFDLSNAEERRLHEYGALFGIESTDAEQIAMMAKKETLQGIMEPYMDRNELLSVARNIDLSDEQAERMYIDYKKSI